MIILGLIFIIIGSILIAALITSEQTDIITALGIFLSVLLIIIGAGCLNGYRQPQAIDVYRGKTTLQITYKNNVPIDTTIVYK